MCLHFVAMVTTSRDTVMLGCLNVSLDGEEAGHVLPFHYDDLMY